jgi:hypothetical protein
MHPDHHAGHPLPRAPFDPVDRLDVFIGEVLGVLANLRI